jgi:glycosyltransferase involved in cell wall biosynthesis
MPRFSVIMPCFNHASFIGESIEAVLTQSVRDLELIVVDDCSRDGSREVIEKYVRHDNRVRTIYHESNLGASRSRNDGIRVAQGEFLAFCDADDVWMPIKLERQLELLEKYPVHDVAYCDSAIIDECGIETGERFSDQFPVPGNGSGRLFDQLCTRNFVNIQTVALRRRCVVDAGYFDESIKWVEDWSFWLRIAYRHSFIYKDEVLAKYRVHQRSTMRVQRKGYKANRIRVFHRTLRNYPKIASKLKAELYYHIGVNLMLLGKKKYARRCFMRSMKFRRLGLRTLYRLLLSFSEVPVHHSGIQLNG